METYFKDNKSDSLILFLLGWGMDERPFRPLKSTCDVLFIYGYSDLNLDFELHFSKYKKITLIAFSCGVFMASLLKEKFPKIDLKIAVNGTLILFDEKLGLTKDKYKVLENISPKNYMEFRRKYLTETKEELDLFNKNQPFRSFENATKELKMLNEYHSKNKDSEFEYDIALIAKQDNTLLTENQINYWEKSKTPYKLINGGHFNFYKFKDIDEIINLASN